MRHKDFHLEHFAIGLSRVKAAVAMCDLPPVEKGTMYSDRFKPKPYMPYVYKPISRTDQRVLDDFFKNKQTARPNGL